MKATKTHKEGGYTLIELAAGIALLLAISLILMELMKVSVHSLASVRRYANLTGEATLIQGIFQRLVGTSMIYSVHGSLADAQSGNNAATAGDWLRLVYPPASFGGAIQRAVIGQQDSNLVYYRQNPTTETWPANGSPSWVIARNLSTTTFSGANMMLRTTLTWGAGGGATSYTLGIDPL